MAIEALNPTTGEVIRQFEPHTNDEVRQILGAVDAAYLVWKETTFAERGDRMRALAEQLRNKRWAFARMMADEMGKPVTGGLAEIEKCAQVCEFYADRAEGFLSDELLESDAGKSYVCYRPLGIVLAVMPWNFPFWQVLRFAAPALMAGNVGVLKHASNVPHCALAIEDLFVEAGFPENVFRTLLIGASQVDPVIEDPRVKAVTLTGSENAGRRVAAKAGEMLKKTVMELGGSDPYVVLEDADLDAAVETAVIARTINSGQSCIAAKRFIVVNSVYEQFLQAFVDRMAALKMGDPLDETVQVGPQARQDLRDELHGQVMASIEKGATLALGGTIPEGSGSFYPPTVLTGVKPGMPAYDEELFGPVASVIRVADETEALQVANDTLYGLGGSVWTCDPARGERFAGQIESGAVFVNGMTKSDPRLPFGGIKLSGFGRELSWHGIREFVNAQTVWVR